MDQLHEELKQPIREEQENGTVVSNIHTAPNMSVVGVQDRQMSMDSSISSQSDGDYETCDSALGSERETNHSGDEGNDAVETSRLNPPFRQARSRNSFSRSEDINDTGNRPGNLKEKKDNLNKSVKASDFIGSCSDDQKSESGDYADAETEPLRPRRRGNRTLSSGSLDRETSKTLYNKNQHASYDSTEGKGNFHYVTL